MEDTEVLIIGAGMAGLAAARRLHRAGRHFLVVEAANRVGGRVVTDVVDGFRIDRGFQVVNTAYPRLAALVDLSALRLGYFREGVLVRHRGDLVRYAHPVRDARGTPAMAKDLARHRIGTLADHARLAGLLARYAGMPVSRLLDTEERTAAEALSSLSPAMLDGLVRPYLAGVFADPDLGVSEHVLAMVVRSFARGRIGLPAAGIAAVPEALAAPLPRGRIRLAQRVDRLDGMTAWTSSGPLRARAVIVATDPVTAARLVPAVAAPRMLPLTTVYHVASRPPLREPVLVVDGDGWRHGGVLNTIVVSNAVPSYAPGGRALIATTLAAADADERAVRRELARVYGTPTDGWEHLTTVRIPDALPEAAPPTHRLRRPTRMTEGLYVAGDHRDSPSVQGALASGWRAAAQADADLARQHQIASTHA
ncbi:NAD(P)/FAD-dependent oxidoreductase [Actinocorallia sp. A-T 12471]|uniref:NAD(P)/FAD-dependent oxidoreductase n=1 Tax=Actinocorallia sp. A-T 12471 TaxID=3089813 RepID=UPI0029D2CB22|nr:NAD(P)/FAD-dependent oxidoreductase [Actinocorallia sp. A-T 12471]MDX6739682.1 NAD(P)/FAD-dependent oxidoreductase [Actinocorallia sp. A-T 12471]